MDNTVSDDPLPISQIISMVKGYIWNLMCCTKQHNSYQKETVHNDAPNQKFRLKKKIGPFGTSIQTHVFSF